MRFGCALVGMLLLGSGCAAADEPASYLGGLDARSFADIGELIAAAREAGVPCVEPKPFDAYAGFATDQVYPSTEAVRCRADDSATVFFLYETAEDRIRIYERGVIQKPSCEGLSDETKRTSHSVAGGNWRVTSVGTDRILRLIKHFDGQPVEEPIGCFPQM